MSKKHLEFDPLTIGKRIREMRLARRLNQDELAELCGLSTSLIGQIERGEKSPSLSTSILLCRFFDVSLDTLILGRADAICDQSNCPLYSDLEQLVQKYKGRTSIIK